MSWVGIVLVGWEGMVLVWMDEGRVDMPCSLHRTSDAQLQHISGLFRTVYGLQD